jgi:hypothetical protein
MLKFCNLLKMLSQKKLELQQIIKLENSMSFLQRLCLEDNLITSASFLNLVIFR